jgi:hypothetical protein
MTGDAPVPTTESLPAFDQYAEAFGQDEDVPALDALDDMLTDAAGLLDRVAQHLVAHRHNGTMHPHAFVPDQVQLAWATTKTAQAMLRDVIALQVPDPV